MTRILLVGCLGKMGRALGALAAHRECEIVAGVDRAAGEAAFPVYTSVQEVREAADVLVDFSRPDSLESILSYAVGTGTPCVLATTGYSAEERQSIANAARSCAIFNSGNMSLGVNILCTLVEKTASVLGEGCDIEIVETHHNQKVDAPSGTALMLADAANSAYMGTKTYTLGRSGESRRSRSEIGISSVRGGNIVGEHEVMFFTRNEKLALKHYAYDRAVFADGALSAAVFMASKKSGLYSMKELVDAGRGIKLEVLEGMRMRKAPADRSGDVMSRAQSCAAMLEYCALRSDGFVFMTDSAHAADFIDMSVPCGDDAELCLVKAEGKSIDAGRFIGAVQSCFAQTELCECMSQRAYVAVRSAYRRALTEALTKEFAL